VNLFSGQATIAGSGKGSSKLCGLAKTITVSWFVTVRQMFLPSGPRTLPVISDDCVFARVLREEGSSGWRSCVPQASVKMASAESGVRQPGWVSMDTSVVKVGATAHLLW
jgi:hypothetical protein